MVGMFILNRVSQQILSPVLQLSLILLERKKGVPPFSRMTLAVWVSVCAASPVNTQGMPISDNSSPNGITNSVHERQRVYATPRRGVWIVLCCPATASSPTAWLCHRLETQPAQIAETSTMALSPTPPLALPLRCLPSRLISSRPGS